MTSTTLSGETTESAAADHFSHVRGLTDRLTSRLSPEDQIPQSMTPASPTAWHRAHTTWFFEEFVLGSDPDYQPVDPAYRYLFNSYYEAIGPRQPRPDRGLITRPSVAEIGDYRAAVDERVLAALREGRLDRRALDLLELGCHHEQQHQELLLMDIKHLLSHNPMPTVYVPRSADPATASPGKADHVVVVEGPAHIGADGDGFSYDNERPRHTEWIPGVEVATRQVTVGEWKEFMADGGYDRPEFWLSDGWHTVQAREWEAPGYWRRGDVDGAPGGAEWTTFTLSGRRPVVDAEPVMHVSFYEADAYARWAGARLPTEFEWEVSAGRWPVRDELDPDRCHPLPAADRAVGGVWEWTASAYLPYPGFEPEEGAAGEYNGKFMSDQHILRGGSALTPAGHTRPTYRNFFPGDSRWAATGLRLAW